MSYSQDKDQLIRIHNISNLSSLSAISNPLEGNLVYINSEEKLYLRTNNEWIPLEKTKSFVEKNHHLPNIKSAKQIEKEGGILLNEAIPKNLEKIEEAFLYVFELNSRLKSLEEKIESLEK